MTASGTQKRPRGLKAASQEESSQKQAKLSNDEDQEATIEWDAEQEDLSAEQLENLSEFQRQLVELEVLFRHAQDKLDSNDAESAVLMWRACVHECDKLLRTFHAKNERFLSLFHYIYGESLHFLGTLLKDESEEAAVERVKRRREGCLDYYEAALERLEIALESTQNEANVDDKLKRFIVEPFRIYEAMGKISLEMVSSILLKKHRHRPTKLLADKAIEDYFEKVIESRPDKRVHLGWFVQEHADLYSSEEWEQREKYNLWAMKQFEAALEKDPTHIEALRGSACCHLSLGTFFIELLDNDECDPLEQDLSVPKKHLSTALAQVDAAIEMDRSNMNLQCLRGEIYINLGVISELQESDEATGYYQEAVNCFKKVEKEDDSALPEKFLEFLQNWQTDS